METCCKAFRREVIQFIPIEENRFAFAPEITLKVAKHGLRIYQVGTLIDSLGLHLRRREES